MFTIKKQYIITEAKQIKEYAEKNKKMPNTNTYADGTIYSIYTTSCFLASLIRNWSKSQVDPISVIIYNQKKYSDSINEKVLKDDYLKMIDNFLKYCNENHRTPSYITTQKSKIKVSFELFVYGLAKIVVYYAENNVLPNYCLFNKNDLQNGKNIALKPQKSTNTPTSNGTFMQKNLLLNKGCSGMAQCTPYYCACNSLQQMFYSLTGKLVSESTIASWAGTTKNGTDHQGINTAVAMFNKKYGTNLKISWKNFSDLGKDTNARFKAMGELMSRNNTRVFLHLNYRNQYGHYEVPYQINTNTKMLKICNSLGTKNSDGSYQGYIEDRTYALQQQYISGVSQKSICIIEK